MKFSSTLLTLASAIGLTSATFSASGNSNVVLYWGQNSEGTQLSLGEYCQSNAADMYVISFLNAFPSTSLNIVSCYTTFDGSDLLHCPDIATDIKTCQGLGKKVLLSLGGAVGNYGFSSDSEAEAYAETLWNMFGGGSADQRPFDDAIIDGFDLDIENNNPTGYAALVTKLREYFDGGEYYISAAPQCVFPDANVGDALANSYIDFAFVQFYNNPCGVDKGTNFNWDTWKDYATNTSPNKNIKIYLGIPASSTAASSGYSSVSEINTIVSQIGSDSSFGGIMMWDASQAFGNIVSGSTYSADMKNVLTTFNLGTGTSVDGTGTNDAAIVIDNGAAGAAVSSASSVASSASSTLAVSTLVYAQSPVSSTLSVVPVHSSAIQTSVAYVQQSSSSAVSPETSPVNAPTSLQYSAQTQDSQQVSTLAVSVQAPTTIVWQQSSTPADSTPQSSSVVQQQDTTAPVSQVTVESTAPASQQPAVETTQNTVAPASSHSYVTLYTSQLISVASSSSPQPVVATSSATPSPESPVASSSAASPLAASSSSASPLAASSSAASPLAVSSSTASPAAEATAIVTVYAGAATEVVYVTQSPAVVTKDGVVWVTQIVEALPSGAGIAANVVNKQKVAAEVTAASSSSAASTDEPADAAAVETDLDSTANPSAVAALQSGGASFVSSSAATTTRVTTLFEDFTVKLSGDISTVVTTRPLSGSSAASSATGTADASRIFSTITRTSTLGSSSASSTVLASAAATLASGSGSIIDSSKVQGVCSGKVGNSLALCLNTNFAVDNAVELPAENAATASSAILSQAATASVQPVKIATTAKTVTLSNGEVATTAVPVVVDAVSAAAAETSASSTSSAPAVKATFDANSCTENAVTCKDGKFALCNFNKWVLFDCPLTTVCSAKDLNGYNVVVGCNFEYAVESELAEASASAAALLQSSTATPTQTSATLTETSSVSDTAAAATTTVEGGAVIVTEIATAYATAYATVTATAASPERLLKMVKREADALNNSGSEALAERGHVGIRARHVHAHAHAHAHINLHKKL